MKYFYLYLGIVLLQSINAKEGIIPTLSCESGLNLTDPGQTLASEGIKDQLDFGTCVFQTSSILKVHEINSNPNRPRVSKLLSEEIAVGYHRRKGETSQFTTFELLNNGTSFCDVINTMRGTKVHYGYDPKEGSVARFLVHLESLFNQIVPFKKSVEDGSASEDTRYPANKEVEYCLNNTISDMVDLSKKFKQEDIITMMLNNKVFEKVFKSNRNFPKGGNAYDEVRLFKSHFLSYLKQKDNLNYFSLLLGD
ncbi:hypothetical protein N9N67_01120, partial [Bacteriovoracaceae bacterium]|nr:hypothetical protein [Bacteriovoracaceae bacterium]